jgi:transposase InsO family protein
MNLRFGNAAVPKPIRAKKVMTRHQIDLISMNNWPTKFEGKTYRYVLSILDVFSRFVFLRPLKSKSSSEVAKHLESVYNEHGPPNILQSDRGTEFLGDVHKLMDRLHVRTVKSRAYTTHSPKVKLNAVIGHSGKNSYLIF